MRKVILLTNNWRKIEQLQKHDLEGASKPLVAKITEVNRSYLEANWEKPGHTLQLNRRAPRR
ncbi:hypothetical protein Ato02nite_086640 [Paractinoplanes toevensis]|uniref:Uncharacterized protein n=1 Tax=Paractinoplanes toevensis TaxID=571911 RepID=A0A920BQN1_9ACTN|nr:hypothetical protein Ato02nite_086640 [Actinoplanes toevensis]